MRVFRHGALCHGSGSDPFDFFPAHYDAQLVAGYSKNTAKQGLKTYMPDHDDLVRRARQ